MLFCTLQHLFILLNQPCATKQQKVWATSTGHIFLQTLEVLLSGSRCSTKLQGLLSGDSEIQRKPVGVDSWNPHDLRGKNASQPGGWPWAFGEPKNRMTSEIFRCNHDASTIGGSIREAKATWLNHTKHDVSVKSWKDETIHQIFRSHSFSKLLSSSAQLGPSSLRKSISRAFVRSKAASWTALIGGSSRIFLMPSYKNMMDTKQHRSQKVDTNTYYIYISHIINIIYIYTFCISHLIFHRFSGNIKHFGPM